MLLLALVDAPLALSLIRLAFAAPSAASCSSSKMGLNRDVTVVMEVEGGEGKPRVVKEFDGKRDGIKRDGIKRDGKKRDGKEGR